MNGLLVKALYILLQGVFLPLLLVWEEYRYNHQVIQAWLVFVLYEALVYVDAIRFVKIFGKEKP